MGFYEDIAEHYDHIFPFSKTQIDFVRGSLKRPYDKKKILDVGCGTGDLSIALSKEGFDVTGIDSDQTMVQIALDRKTDNPVVFEQMDMKDIARHYNSSTFDAVLCFGNTLVHLADIREIEKLCRDTRSILKQNGRFLIQILNYNHIIDHKIRSLPIIDNEFVRFERTYDYNSRKNVLSFKTTLTVKETSKKIVNNIFLFPVRKDELYLSLRNNGFSNISFFGDFDRNALKPDSLPLVVEAL